METGYENQFLLLMKVSNDIKYLYMLVTLIVTSLKLKLKAILLTYVQ